MGSKSVSRGSCAPGNPPVSVSVRKISSPTWPSKLKRSDSPEKSMLFSVTSDPQKSSVCALARVGAFASAIDTQKEPRVKPSAKNRFMTCRVDLANYRHLPLKPHADGNRDDHRSFRPRACRREHGCQDTFVRSRQSRRSKPRIHTQARHNARRRRAAHDERGWNPPKRSAFESSTPLIALACLANSLHLAVKRVIKIGCDLTTIEHGRPTQRRRSWGKTPASDPSHFATVSLRRFAGDRETLQSICIPHTVERGVCARALRLFSWHVNNFLWNVLIKYQLQRDTLLIHRSNKPSRCKCGATPPVIRDSRNHAKIKSSKPDDSGLF